MIDSKKKTLAECPIEYFYKFLEHTRRISRRISEGISVDISKGILKAISDAIHEKKSYGTFGRNPEFPMYKESTVSSVMFFSITVNGEIKCNFLVFFFLVTPMFIISLHVHVFEPEDSHHTYLL